MSSRDSRGRPPLGVGGQFSPPCHRGTFFTSRERKSEVRRRSDTVLALTTNEADWRSGTTSSPSRQGPISPPGDVFISRERKSEVRRRSDTVAAALLRRRAGPTATTPRDRRGTGRRRRTGGDVDPVFAGTRRGRPPLGVGGQFRRPATGDVATSRERKSEVRRRSDTVVLVRTIGAMPAGDRSGTTSSPSRGQCHRPGAGDGVLLSEQGPISPPWHRGRRRGGPSPVPDRAELVPGYTGLSREARELGRHCRVRAPIESKLAGPPGQGVRQVS
jgi:hypothetical protein